MKVRSLRDAIFLARFALDALAPRVILRRLLAQMSHPLITARYLDPDGSVSPVPRSLPAALVNLWRLRRRTPAPFEPLGRRAGYRREGRALDITYQGGTVRVEFLAPDLVRVRLSADGSFPEPFSYAVEKRDWPAPEVSLAEAGGAVEFGSARLRCRARDPFALEFLTPEGEPVARLLEMGWCGREVRCSFTLADGARVYGLGEKAFGLNRRGHRYVMWNSDPELYEPGDDPLYQSIPFFVVLERGRAWGVFLDNPFRSVFDVGCSDPERITVSAEGGELRLYFFWGPEMARVLERYTELTGRMPLPPLWALGYQQSRWSYSTEEEVRQLAAEFRRRRIPCDVIYLDLDYMEGKRCFTWSRERFPRHREMLRDLRRRGFKVVCILDPGIKAERGYRVCDEGISDGMFCRLPDGSLYRGPVWPGECYFPDFTDPRVREWWGELYREMVEDGVAGFWNDMNEPTVFGAGTFPAPVQHHNEGRPTDHRECHNLYGMLMARATFEGVGRLRPGERPFVLTRATFAGGQRYGATWTGDNASTWEHLRLCIPMCLNLGLSGFSFAGPDIGGFARSADGELLVRWTQLGVFLPLFRNHSAVRTARQEPWAFGRPYEDLCREAISLRYHLLPYLYTAFWECASTGMPVIRPLAMAWPQDEAALSEDTEFLCGDALLVAPVLHPGATDREVYLPTGGWFHLWDNSFVEGPARVHVEAPLHRIPVYVRAGSVIPCWPAGFQHTDEAPGDTLILRVYPGEGESVLYEDDGRTLEYLDGQFRLTRFVVGGGRNGLSLRVLSEGEYPSPYRRWEVWVHGGRRPRHVMADGRPVEGWAWSAEERTIRFETVPFTELELEW